MKSLKVYLTVIVKIGEDPNFSLNFKIAIAHSFKTRLCHAVCNTSGNFSSNFRLCGAKSSHFKELVFTDGRSSLLNCFYWNSLCLWVSLVLVVFFFFGSDSLHILCHYSR